MHPPTVVPAGKYSVLVYLRKHSAHSESWFDDFKISVKRGYTEPVLSAEVLSSNSYYAFGLMMYVIIFNSIGYRYRFNGQEKDDEIKGSGNSYDFGARIYDPRLGRFFSRDPMTKKFPFYTPYLFASNKPVLMIDLNGEIGWVTTNDWSYEDIEGFANFVQTEVARIHAKALEKGLTPGSKCDDNSIPDICFDCADFAVFHAY